MGQELVDLAARLEQWTQRALEAAAAHRVPPELRDELRALLTTVHSNLDEAKKSVVTSVEAAVAESTKRALERKAKREAVQTTTKSEPAAVEPPFGDGAHCLDEPAIHSVIADLLVGLDAPKPKKAPVQGDAWQDLDD
jgi:hypothetical protein